jgi:uncharacterized protein (TIGR02466 family)
MSDTWQQYDYFPSSVYMLDKPEFLEIVKVVAYEYMEEFKKQNKIDEINPLYQSYNFHGDDRIIHFKNYVAQTSWNILSSQGFDMSLKETYFNEMWMHCYLKYGSMEGHVHSNGSYITGLYIIDAPEKCGQIVIHDPRPGKIQMNMTQDRREEVSYSTDNIYFKPKPGMLFFTNSWLPHSITRNASNDPFTLVHFNISIKDYYPPPPPAEVI